MPDSEDLLQEAMDLRQAAFQRHAERLFDKSAEADAHRMIAESNKKLKLYADMPNLSKGSKVGLNQGYKNLAHKQKSKR